MDILLHTTTITGTLLLIGWLLAGPVGFMAGLVLAFVLLAFSFSYSGKFVIKKLKAEPLEDPVLQRMLKYLSNEKGIPTPGLFVVKSSLPNSFSVGRDAKAAVVVTEGLLRLRKNEIRAVLAHEISHIKAGDSLVSAMAALLACTVSYPAQKSYFLLSNEARKGKRFLLSALSVLFALPAAFIIRMSVEKSRELKADWTGALIMKDPEALASALRKMSQAARSSPSEGWSATSVLWIMNPFRQGWFNSIFNTHPPVEERVERLEVVKSSQ